MAQEGLINIRSNRAAADIVSRLDAALVAKGITVFARIDPAWLARRHGIDPATQPTVGAMATLLAALAHDAGAE